MKELSQEIIDEAMHQILSGVRHQNILQLLMSRYKNFDSRTLQNLLDVANEDVMSYTNDMNNNNYSRY